MTLRPLRDRAALRAALPDDLLLRQLAVYWVSSLPAYALGDAVALYHGYGAEPEVVVVGDAEDALELVAAFVAAHPATPGLSAPLATTERLAAGDGYRAEPGWAFRWTDVAPAVPEADGARWLPEEAAEEVAALLAAGFPDASMPVGHPGVRRWAGLRRDGRLVACAADATGDPDLGFVASIASHPAARGTGAGLAITAWTTAALVADHGTCGLWHMSDNAPAVAVYDRLGYRAYPMGFVTRE